MVSSASSRRPRAYRNLVAVSGFLVITLFLKLSYYSDPAEGVANSKRPISKTFVVASVQKDDISWIGEHLPEWEVTRYVVDDPSANLSVPQNKGQEAMAYLTYMIDYYHKLPEVIVFMHSARYQWHNDDPLYDGVPLLQNLQLSHIISQRYTNLRCTWALGCPVEMTFDTEPEDMDSSKSIEVTYPQAFKELFPRNSVPSVIGVPCCAQFAVSREAIRSRPLKDYKRYRQWLLKTSLDSHISGRVLEYSWHMIFGKESVLCPNAQECYCKTFGLCDLECEEGKCGERWPIPPFATLPHGWPMVGWDGETRDADLLANMRNVAVSAKSPDLKSFA